MLGSDTTSGFLQNRSSCSASGTTNTSGCWIAVEQNAMSREVSVAEIPTLDLNHCRSSSINEISAMGVLQTYEANSVRSSKACSGSLSKIAYFCKADTRAASSFDSMGAPMIDLPRDISPLESHHTPLRRVYESLQQLLQQRLAFQVAEDIFPHESDNQFAEHVILLVAWRVACGHFLAQFFLFFDQRLWVHRAAQLRKHLLKDGQLLRLNRSER